MSTDDNVPTRDSASDALKYANELLEAAIASAEAALIAATWKTTVAQKLDVSTAAVLSTAPVAGNVSLVSDIDCYIKIGAANDVTTVSGGYHFFLPAGLLWPIVFDGVDKISVKTAAGSGGLHICYPQ